MIYDLNCKLKNKADKLTIRKTFLKHLSTDKKDNCFFDNLSYDVKKIFINYGYLPTTENDANNFLNSIAKINEKQQYDIDYAFVDIPKDKQFKLDITTYKYALYPKIWQNLALEDKLVCMNFAYKDLLKLKNLKNTYRLIWVDKLFVYDQNGHVNKDTNVIAINLDKIIKNNDIDGLKLYSTIAHETNHIAQNKLAKSILTLPDKSNLSIYEQRLNSHNALTVGLKENTAFYFLNNEYLEKFNSIDPKKWEKYLNVIYYKYDYLEMSSISVQLKSFKNVCAECFNYFNDDYTQNKDLQNFISILESYNSIKKLRKGDFKNFCIKKTDNCNQLRTICGFVYDRLFHLNNILMKENLNMIKLSNQTKQSILNEYYCCNNILKYIYKTLVDGYFNNGLLPSTFNTKLFNYINLFLDKKQESVQDTINYHDNHANENLEICNQILDIITPKEDLQQNKQDSEQDIKQQNEQQENNPNL